MKTSDSTFLVLHKTNLMISHYFQCIQIVCDLPRTHSPLVKYTGAGVWDSILMPVKSDTVAIAVTCAAQTLSAEMGLATRYTPPRNIASIMKI